MKRSLFLSIGSLWLIPCLLTEAISSGLPTVELLRPMSACAQVFEQQTLVNGAVGGFTSLRSPAALIRRIGEGFKLQSSDPSARVLLAAIVILHAALISEPTFLPLLMATTDDASKPKKHKVRKLSGSEELLHNVRIVMGFAGKISLLQEKALKEQALRDNVEAGEVWIDPEYIEGMSSHISELVGMAKAFSDWYQTPGQDTKMLEELLYKLRRQEDFYRHPENQLLKVSVEKVEYLADRHHIARLLFEHEPMYVKNALLEEWIHRHIGHILGTRVVVKGDPEDPIFFTGQETALFNVLFNLVQNARKHGGTQDVTIELMKLPYDWVQILVIDKGEGMSPEHLAIVNEILSGFTEVHFTTSPQDGNPHGLGLHIIARNTLEILRGVIEADSTPREGSTFKLLIPASTPLPAPTPEYRKKRTSLNTSA